MAHDGAFELAARIRSARADLITAVRDGACDLTRVFASEDPFVQAVKVVTVIESLPGLGKVAARRLLDEVDVPSDCKIRDIDALRKEALLSRLDRRAS